MAVEARFSNRRIRIGSRERGSPPYSNSHSDYIINLCFGYKQGFREWDSEIFDGIFTNFVQKKWADFTSALQVEKEETTKPILPSVLRRDYTMHNTELP